MIRHLSNFLLRGFLVVFLLGIAVAELLPQDSTARPTSGATAQPSDAAGSSIAPQALAKIPQRATNADGSPGAATNFLIVGAEGDLKLLFQAGQWEPVGHAKSTTNNVPEGLSEQAYLAMPLSELYMFGRPQDYGFTLAEPVVAVQARHTVRIWKAPFGAAGKTLWVGVAVPQGPWWDDSIGGVSNKNNPNLDAERKFVGDTLNATGLVLRSGYVQFPDAPAKARPAKDNDSHTDGRIFVMTLIDLPGK